MSSLKDMRVWISALTVATIAAGVPAGARWWKGREQQRRDDAVAAAQLAAADKSRADQVRLESERQRALTNAARTSRLDDRVQSALTRLTSDRVSARCDAALDLGRLGAKEHVAALADAMSSDAAATVRVCAASALVTLGDRDATLRTYEQWAYGHDEVLRRGALMGFGDIGPAAATAAIPHLAEALGSPYVDLRYLAVDSLAKLGPAAVPILKAATNDADRHVRDYAVRAVRTLERR